MQQLTFNIHTLMEYLIFFLTRVANTEKNVIAWYVCFTIKVDISIHHVLYFIEIVQLMRFLDNRREGNLE